MQKNNAIKGYTKRPLIIIILSIVYLLNPIGNIIFQYIINDYSFSVFWRVIFQRIFILGDVYIAANAILWIMGIVVAYGLFKVRLWAWFLFLAHSASMFTLSLYNNVTGVFSFSSMSLVNLLFALPMGLLIFDSIRTPYFNPRVRWWEQHDRLRHTIEVILNGEKYETYDISRKGVFVAAKDLDQIEVGHTLKMELDLGDNIQLDCDIEVVFEHPEIKNYPKGFGAKFVNMDRETQGKIDNYIKEKLKVKPELVRG